MQVLVGLIIKEQKQTHIETYTILLICIPYEILIHPLSTPLLSCKRKTKHLKKKLHFSTTREFKTKTRHSHISSWNFFGLYFLLEISGNMPAFGRVCFVNFTIKKGGSGYLLLKKQFYYFNIFSTRGRVFFSSVSPKETVCSQSNLEAVGCISAVQFITVLNI